MGRRPVLEEVRCRLRSDPRGQLASGAISLAFDGGVLTMDGEVASIAAKKLALESAASVPSVDHIVDRLRVTPSRAMGDAEIRDHVRDLISSEPSFQPLVRESPSGAGAGPLGPDAICGAIGISVDDGVVTLDGVVPSLSHKRLAGVLAWWVPGTRDVVNGLEVLPPEEDSADEISDAVHLALEKDPLVDASQVGVSTRGGVVTLTGAVHSEAQRDAAERDAWCVFGVDGVSNQLRVRS